MKERGSKGKRLKLRQEIQRLSTALTNSSEIDYSKCQTSLDRYLLSNRIYRYWKTELEKELQLDIQE